MLSQTPPRLPPRPDLVILLRRADRLQDLRPASLGRVDTTPSIADQAAYLAGFLRAVEELLGLNAPLVRGQRRLLGEPRFAKDVPLRVGRSSTGDNALQNDERVPESAELVVH